MEETNYSKRELDEHFRDLGGKMDANTDLTKDLVTKVGIQNGRVGKLEGKFNGVALAGTVAVFLLGIIMSLVVYSFNKSMENQKNEILLEISKD